MFKRWWLIFWGRWLIRFGRITESVYTKAEIDALLGEHLPQHHGLQVPGGKGDLLVHDAEVNLDDSTNNRVHITITASIELFALNQRVYRAHIRGELSAAPYYDNDRQTLIFTQPTLDSLTLVDDSYFVIESGAGLIDSLTPNVLKSVMGVAVGTAVGVLRSVTDNELRGYLSLFTLSGKQKVIDFHRAEIEQHLFTLVDKDTLKYRLDPDDYEEQLFIELGKDVVVQHGQLVFRF